MPRAGAAAPRRTRVPPPREESPDRQGGHGGSRRAGGPWKGETALGKGGQERFTPTLPRHFAPGWGEALPSPRDVNFLLQSRGERFHFKGGNKARRFFQAGAGRERDAEEGGSPWLGAALPPGMRRASPCACPGAGQHLGVSVRAPQGNSGCGSPLFRATRNRAPSDTLGPL